MVLTADSVLARSTRRRQTSTGWNTAYIGANRYTLPRSEKPPADDVLYPMAFLVEKGPGAVTRPHFHQAARCSTCWSSAGATGLPAAAVAYHRGVVRFRRMPQRRPGDYHRVPAMKPGALRMSAGPAGRTAMSCATPTRRTRCMPA